LRARRARYGSRVERLRRRFGRRRLVASARALAERRGWHLAPASGYDLVPRSYYSPVPDLERLPESFWSTRSSMPGIHFDTAEQLAWAEERLAPFIAEFDAPATGRYGSGSYFYENRSFEYGDAEIAYSMVRHARPERILELGSGFSTLVLCAAALANERDGVATRLVSNDPFPRGVAPAGTPGLTALRERGAEDVPLDDFLELGAGDVLFVDTTHTVKVGSEVNRIVLEVLPRLRAGVLVHVHDVYLPYEYPRELIVHHDAFWAEQYLLQALLAGNRDFEVVFATHAVSREHPDGFRRLVPRYSGANVPNGIWLRRTAGEA
jgi:hypothetical protein